jgi:hypothetical protein
MSRLGCYDNGLVLELIADVLTIGSSDILGNLLPSSSHLVWRRLLTVVKDVCSKVFAQSFLDGSGCASVVLATTSAASTTSIAAYATTVGSCSSA